MDRPWLNQYPNGIPAEVDVLAYATIGDILDKSCKRFALMPAYSSMDVSLSYRRLDRLSADFAAYLQGVVGLRKGDRVALMLPNLLQYPVAMFGVLRAGCVVVNVNPLYTPRELEHQLVDSGASAIVVIENFAHVLEQVVSRTRIAKVITTQVGDLFPPFKAMVTNAVVKYIKKLVPAWRLQNTCTFVQALRIGRKMKMHEVAIARDDIAFLQYTGGTTGVAKGAALTHGNIVANLQQLSAWVARGLKEGSEIAIIPLPLYHIYALIVNLVFMKIGAHVILIANPRDLPAFVKTLRHSRPSALVGVNTLFSALLDTEGFAQVDFSRLRIACAGGMAVQRSVARRWKQTTGVPIVEGYGLTEASPVVTSNTLDIPDWTGTIGLPLPSTDVCVVDEAGIPLPPGEVGEIAVRGPQVMQGYWRRPEETAKVFMTNGWLRTGDMGYMDEQGFFRITDRKKDMILTSGFKIFPNEVEDVVAMHPGVLEVAVIGVPDQKSGEVAKIIAVKRDPSLTEEALLAHCRQYLTGYKVPRFVEFRTEPLPKSNIGKILRRMLRDSEQGSGTGGAKSP